MNGDRVFLVMMLAQLRLDKFRPKSILVIKAKGCYVVASRAHVAC